VSETTTEELPDDAPWWRRNRELLEPAVAATALLAGWLLQRNEVPPAAWGTLFAISYVVAGWSAFAEGLRELRRGHLDVDFLMAVAALGAAATAFLVTAFRSTGLPLRSR
jgi:cation transport ATPase